MRKFFRLSLLLSMLYFHAGVLTGSEPVDVNSVVSKYTYDENGIRYQLVNSNPVTNKNWNWIFIPGGPGCDSSSLLGLTQLLDLPGNTWLIDFPGNGSNVNGISADYDYDQWFNFVIPMVKRFENPIVFGASFGGMITLLTPELENYLKGVVILSSAPRIWWEEASLCAIKYNLPDLSPELQEFIVKPSEETLKKLIDVCVLHYYFYKEESIEKGRALLLSTPFAFQPAFWWMHKVASEGYTATWIPENVPALIIGNEFDYMTPFEIFQNDPRFLRPNIKMVEIKEASHFNWVDNPDAVKAAFQSFSDTLN
jgi:pimeloyl-ACP methyl ester carboxylesterase